MYLCLKYISYDPNYNYDDEDEELNDEKQDIKNGVSPANGIKIDQ